MTTNQSRSRHTRSASQAQRGESTLFSKIRTENGQAVGEAGRTPAALEELRSFVENAIANSDQKASNRGLAVLSYIEGYPVWSTAQNLGIQRHEVHRALWLYERHGVAGLSMETDRFGMLVGSARRTPAAVDDVKRFLGRAKASGNELQRQRGEVVLAYLEGEPLSETARKVGAGRALCQRWLRLYDKSGVGGLGGARYDSNRRLKAADRKRLAELLDLGPRACGYDTDGWTGGLIWRLVEERFGIRYGRLSVFHVLRKLGFSRQPIPGFRASPDRKVPTTWLRTGVSKYRNEARHKT